MWPFIFNANPYQLIFNQTLAHMYDKISDVLAIREGVFLLSIQIDTFMSTTKIYAA